MLKNYLITAFRYLTRQKGFTIINISGLAIGIAIAILIFLWVAHELSYDKFNQKSDRLYRLVQTQYYASGPLTTSCMPGPVAKDLRDEIPEIINSFIYYDIPMTVNAGDKVFTENIILSGPELFSMFDFAFISGNPDLVFEELNSAVITDKMAVKLFGHADVLGKTLKLNDQYSYKITGVIAETPENSSFRFELCIPFENIRELGYSIDTYGWNSYFVYVELAESDSYQAVNEKIKSFLEEKTAKKNQETVAGDSENQIDLFLFPLEKIHLYSFDNQRGDIQYVYIFSAIALFIVLIACINYMNLSTARSLKRSREISIRKSIGADRKKLIMQFLGESILIAFAAMALAVALVVLLLPGFNQLTQKEITFEGSNFNLWILLIGVTLVTGLLAGSYPSFYLSAFNPREVRQKASGNGRDNSAFRRVLVVFQFFLSVVLIICTLVIYRQLDFLHNNKLGMEIQNVSYFSLRGSTLQKFDILKNELLANPNILNVSRGNTLPFYIGSNSGGMDWEGKDTEDNIIVGFTFADEDYLDVLGMALAEGRFFSKEIQSDTAAVVINQKAARAFGMENPVGKWLSWGGNRFRIIGVVNDFHHLPMQRSIDPLGIFYVPEQCDVMFVKTADSGGKNPEMMQATWESLVKGFPFEPKSLKAAYDDVYRDEARLIRIIGYFALLAVFISCLGLFALSTYLTEQRTREIGIRRILGATTPGIMTLVSAEYLKWVLIANFIAWPVAWFTMNDWLRSYSYHTRISVDLFAIAFVLSVVIALATISFHAVNSARKKPVEAIKYE